MKLKRRAARYRHLWFSVWNQDQILTPDAHLEKPAKVSGR